MEIAGVALAAAAVVLAVAQVYYAWRSKPPRWRLTIHAEESVPLLSGNANAASGLLVSCNGRELAGGYVTTVHIENSGRRDISSAQFDERVPLLLTIGVPLIALLDVSSTSERVAPPPIETGDASVEIGPGLFKRRSRTTIQILTESEPDFDYREQLIETNVKLVTAAVPSEPRTERMHAALIVSISLLVVYLLARHG